ncbi:hypothetical protein ABFX02_08G181300 [Erythranthe guttata]
MSGGGARWIVAASIGAVEALKDQLGVCRWNYAFRILQQNAKTTLQSAATSFHTRTQQNNNNVIKSSSNYDAAAAAAGNNYKIEEREMGLKKVMDLSCWGPTTVRF